MGAIKQVVVTYHGRVQGVGFRFTAARLSERFVVTGYVQNQPGGSVLLVAEGAEETLHKFMGSIRASSVGGYVTRQDVVWGPPSRQYDKFSVK